MAIQRIDDYASQPQVVVMTSDKYLPALRPFAWLLNKYWLPNPPVLVAGFGAPSFELPDNFSFYSIGNMVDYPFNKWSNAMHNLLALGPVNDTFVLMLEDYWLTRHVDTRAIHILDKYAQQFKYVLKIDLAEDRLHAFGADLNYSTVSYLDLIKSMPGSPYHMSLWIGLWRRDQMLRTLVPNESPHDLEIIGTTRVSHLQDQLVLGTKQAPCKITLGLRGGDSTRVNLEGLRSEDREAMESMGYFDSWKE